MQANGLFVCFSDPTDILGAVYFVFDLLPGVFKVTLNLLKARARLIREPIHRVAVKELFDICEHMRVCCFYILIKSLSA